MLQPQGLSKTNKKGNDKFNAVGKIFLLLRSIDYIFFFLLSSLIIVSLLEEKKLCSLLRLCISIPHLIKHRGIGNVAATGTE